MNAIEMLRGDHRHLKQLLGQLVGATDVVARQGLLERIDNDLALHTRLEEDVFYPALRAAQGGGDDEATMVFEALEEHRVVSEKALPDLREVALDAPEFEGRAKVLKELVEHHVGEEERDMFPRARDLMDEAQLNALGHQMAHRRAELFAQGQRGHGQSSGNGKAHGVDRVEAWMAQAGERVEHQVQALADDPLGAMGRMAQALARGAGKVALEIDSGVRRGVAEAREERDRQQR